MTRIGYAISIRVSGRRCIIPEQRQLQRGLDWVEMSFANVGQCCQIECAETSTVFSPPTPRNKRVRHRLNLQTQNRRMLSRLMIRNLPIRGHVLGQLVIERFGSSLQRDARGLHNISHEA